MTWWALGWTLWDGFQTFSRPQKRLLNRGYALRRYRSEALYQHRNDHPRATNGSCGQSGTAFKPSPRQRHDEDHSPPAIRSSKERDVAPRLGVLFFREGNTKIREIAPIRLRAKSEIDEVRARQPTEPRTPASTGQVRNWQNVVHDFYLDSR